MNYEPWDHDTLNQNKLTPETPVTLCSSGLPPPLSTLYLSTERHGIPSISPSTQILSSHYTPNKYFTMALLLIFNARMINVACELFSETVMENRLVSCLAVRLR